MNSVLKVFFWAIGASVFSTVVLLLPSYKIADEIKVNSPIDFSKFKKPGNTILVSENSIPYQDLKLNGKPFTFLKGHHFAAVGLNRKIYTVTGTAQVDFPNKLFSHGSISYFSQDIKMKIPRAKGNKLRLPSNVIKRVGDEFRQQKNEELAKMRKIIRKPTSYESFNPCWKWPLEKIYRVSGFGKPRRLPNGVSYLHTGLDLLAYLGTPLNSPADGKVIYTGHMIVPGKQVVLDHGDGIKSRYLHLHRIDVKKGDFVKAGQQIGQTGDTGRVEGAHLHWEVIWKGNHSNPQEFLRDLELICDLE